VPTDASLGSFYASHTRQGLVPSRRVQNLLSALHYMHRPGCATAAALAGRDTTGLTRRRRRAAFLCSTPIAPLTGGWLPERYCGAHNMLLHTVRELRPYHIPHASPYAAHYLSLYRAANFPIGACRPLCLMFLCSKLFSSQYVMLFSFSITHTIHAMSVVFLNSC
jgi:hypothetical protein